MLVEPLVETEPLSAAAGSEEPAGAEETAGAGVEEAGALEGAPPQAARLSAIAPAANREHNFFIIHYSFFSLFFLGRFQYSARM